MMMRMLQITCLLVLGLLVSSSRVDGRWEGDPPCTGVHCTSCYDPDPSGEFCYVGPDGGITETCKYYGCIALFACGEGGQRAQCECAPCDN